MIKLGEIFNKSRVTTADINNLIIDIIAYRGTMGSAEVWKILGIFGIPKNTDSKGTAHQKIENLDQNQKNDLYYKLKNLMNLNEIKPVPVVTPKIVWDIIREKYKENKLDAIMDIGFLFEEFGYVKWSKEEGGDYEEYRRTNTAEKLIFLKYLQEQGKLNDFYKKLKAL